MNTILTKRILTSPLAIFLIASLLVWATGFPFWIKYAHAALVTSYKDTISDSDLSALANHTITFTTPTGVASGQTITVTFPAGFTMGSVAFGDVDVTDDGTDVAIAATPVTTTWGAAVAGQVLTLTNGTTAVAAASVMVIEIGTNATFGVAGTSQITNPSSAGSVVISIAGTFTDTGSTRVAIIDDVVVTASVDTVFTFTIAGVVSGSTGANGEAGTTDVTTTATAIPWGTLSAGTAKVARQDLAVTTNAKNGFSVTIWQDQNLLSATGADIDIFKDGTNGASAAWAAPTGTLDSEDTYGHEGITSEDSTLAAGDTFGATLYDAIGTSASPLNVFYHTGPADGTTADKGATKIGFKIQINALQEAGTDYTQSLTYIATPTF